MVRRRRHATRVELELVLVEEHGEVTTVRAVLDSLARAGVDVGALVEIEVDDDSAASPS